jgi:predicted nucleotidyltransferase
MEQQILTKEEVKIIDLFRTGLFKQYTIREIAKNINKKSYNWVFKAIGKLKRLEIINSETKGNSNICSINLQNNLTLIYLSFLEQERIGEKLPLKNIKILLESIPVKYYTFIITGSYASGKQTSKSDLDIAVIVENKEDSKKVFAVLKNKGELMIPKAHIFVFNKEEFLKMLLDKEENYGKQIFGNNIIIFGAENYYLILREAIENGFKG